MTKLSCSAEKCMFNKDNYCCKSDIVVEGKGACNCGETCCGSFHEQGNNSGSNVAEHENPQVEIKCEATNCVHNENEQCKAGNIGIVGKHASYSEQTECGTFKSR